MTGADKPQAELSYYRSLSDQLGARLIHNITENERLLQRARHSELLSALLIQGYRLGNQYDDYQELRYALLRLLIQHTHSDSILLLQPASEGPGLVVVSALGEARGHEGRHCRFVPPLSNKLLIAADSPHAPAADWLRQLIGHPSVAWYCDEGNGQCLVLGKHQTRALRDPFSELIPRLLESACDLMAELALRLEEQQQLHFHATRDPLTGLPNRLLAMDRLEQAVQHQPIRPFHLLRLDLDNFRRLNEVKGHAIGDKLLGEIAKRLEPLIPKGSTLARHGADEFLLLLEEADAQVVELLCRDILRCLDDSYELGDQQAHVTASIGVANYPQDGEDSATLLRVSDIALEQSKQGGRNQCRFYSADMNQELSQQWQLRAALKDAVTKGQLAVHYQPIFAVDSGELVQFEALLRWTHDEYGPVSPADFIPIAETDDTIIKLGNWVIEEVCRQQHQWQVRGLPLVPVAVNISARQLQQSGFIDNLLHQVGRHELTPALIELELTERLLLQQESVGDQLFQQLHALGFALELDDFGTGYSALSYLNRYPFTTLKIDRSFIDQLERDERGHTLVRGVIALAHELGIKTIAEGVETDGQLALLRQIGCDLAQGFLLGRPAPASESSALLQQGPIAQAS